MNSVLKPRQLLVAFLLAAGCSQEGTPLNLEEGLSLELKYFDPGPVLASTDRDVVMSRMEHHVQVVMLRGYSYTVGDNPAVHRDISQLAGLVRPDVVPKGDEEPLPPPLYGDPPDRWDWREQGVGAPIAGDQGTCGSCWAFSTTAALESAIAAFDSEIVDLSEQYLLDCNQEGYSCGGGFYVHDIHQNKGAIYEHDYPYAGRQGYCSDSGLDRPYKILRSGELEPGNIEQIKQAIYEYGSVSVSMNACGSIPGFTGGIYDSTECNWGMTNHAVSLVGWDDTVEHAQGSGIWIMRNSWGRHWGEDGFMRVAYGVAKVGMVDATYVEYEPLDPTDTDEDGVIDIRDNCPEDVNEDQFDADLDGAGDACDSTFDPVVRDVTLSDDDSQVVNLGFAFPFYGESYGEVHINSDGNLTFSDSDSQSQARDQTRFLTGPPRIAALYSDLNPSGGGTVTYRKDDPETLVVIYRSVPEYSRSGSGGSNTAEVTLHSSGRISITVSANTLAENDPRCIVGISRGGSGNDASESDLSSESGGTIAYEGTTAVFEAFSGSDAFDLTDTTVVFAGTAEPNQPPTADIDASTYGGPAPLEVAFTGRGSDEDGEVVAYHWDFGDRTVSDVSDPDKTFEHDGEYSVTLTVTDDQGATGTATTTITVADDATGEEPEGEEPSGEEPGEEEPGEEEPGGNEPGGNEPGGSDGFGEPPISTMFGYGSCSATGAPRSGIPRFLLWLATGLVILWSLRRRP